MPVGRLRAKNSAEIIQSRQQQEHNLFITFQLCDQFSQLYSEIHFSRYCTISEYTFQNMKEIGLRSIFSLFLRTISWIFWKVYKDECNIWYTTQPADRTEHAQMQTCIWLVRNHEKYELQWLYFILFTVTHIIHYSLVNMD